MKYYILSFEHTVGELVTWWRPDEHGYTTNLDEAGQYDEATARRIVSNALPGDEAAIPVSAFPFKACRVVFTGEELEKVFDVPGTGILENFPTVGKLVSPTVDGLDEL